jgi:hypothetical protein
MERKIIEVKVIPCEAPESWSVAIRYSNRADIAYPVGSREDAERQLPNPRPPWPHDGLTHPTKIGAPIQPKRGGGSQLA